MTTLNKSETLILVKNMAEVHAVMPQAIQKSDLDAFGAKTPGFAGSVKRVKATKLHAKLVSVNAYFISDAVDHLPENTPYFVETLADGREPAAKRPRLLAGRVAADGRRDNRDRLITLRWLRRYTIWRDAQFIRAVAAVKVPGRRRVPCRGAPRGELCARLRRRQRRRRQLNGAAAHRRGSFDGDNDISRSNRDND